MGIISNRQDNKFLIMIQSTAFISYISAIIYFFPYTYQASYFSYFGLPAIYQDFSLKTILDASYPLITYLSVIIFLGLLILPSFALKNFLYDLLNSLEDKYINDKNRKSVGLFIILVGLITGISFFYIYDLSELLESLAMIIIGALCVYNFKLLNVLNKMFSRFFLISIILILCMFLFNYLGKLEASNKADFYLLDNGDSNSYIVLGIKQDQYVVATYNIETNDIIKEFQLLSVKEEQKLVLTFLDKPPTIITQEEFEKNSVNNECNYIYE